MNTAAGGVDRYRELFYGIDHGFCLVEIVCDADDRPVDYRIVESNPAFAAHTGLRDAVGRTILEMVPSIEPFWIETYGRVGLTGEPVRFEHRAEGLDGGWFEVSAFRFGDPALRQVAIIFQNIKERRLAQEERERLLREVQTERSRLEDVFMRAPSFMAWLQGPDHVFERANELYFALVGRRDFIGKPLREAIPEAAAQGFVELLDNVYRTGEPYVGTDVPYVRQSPDGGPPEVRFVHFVYQVLRDAAGRIFGIFVQGVDFTERMQAEQALRDADRRKDEFLATLAHELRNPLAPVMNSLAVLDRLAAADALEQPQAAAARATMWRQMKQMVRLVDDLLDVSRITRGAIELRRERVEVRSLVQEAIESVGPAFQLAGQRLDIRLPAAPLWLDADPARVVQVLGNLLRNANRYGGPHAQIDIEAHPEDDSVVISVADTGIGIPADQLQSIFDMFVQGDNLLSRASGGVGIGLYLVRRLVELHGGRVEAHSAGFGCGSQFVLRLPAAAAEAAAAVPVPDSGARAAPVPHGRRVLIADDNLDAADSLALLLQMEGHTTHTVPDGLQAVAAAETLRPEVIVLDIGMPGLNGYEACSRLRQQPWARDTRIIALTGWGQESDKRRSFEHGFDAHLVKPVQLEALQALLQAPAPAARP